MKIPKQKRLKNPRVVREQAEELSRRRLTAGESSALGLEENPLRRARKALRADYVLPIARPLQIKPGDIADPEPLNKLFGAAEEDLNVLARTGDHLGDLLVKAQNTLATGENDLVGELKTLRERIAALKLYVRDITDDDQYIAYSFTDGRNIDVPDGTPATYEEAEGAILLPIEEAKTVEVKEVTIGELSNGVPGNNFNRQRARNVSLGHITDGSPATWFEYERLADIREGDLRLVLRFAFSGDEIVNRVTIDPANLGTSAWVEVEDIRLEVGDKLVSVKGDIGIPSWDATANPFELSPATAKFAGQGLYTFEPRKARAVQITLVQREPYPVLDGAKLRYAIALRDVTIHSVRFAAEGEFKLKSSAFIRPVRAIAALQNAKPYTPADAELTFSISTDGGETYTDIVPLENKDAAKTEALLLKDAVANIIVKGKIKRLSEGFTSKRRQTEDQLQVVAKMHQVPTGASSPIALEAKPETFLEAIRLGLGARGDSAPPLFLGTGDGQIASSSYIALPYKQDLTGLFYLTVNGEAWLPVNSFADQNTKGFIYDKSADPAQLIFGDGVDPAEGGMGGAVPKSGCEIYLFMTPAKKTVFTETDFGFKGTLKFQCDKIQDTTKIYFKDFERQTNTIRVGPNSTYVEFPVEHHNWTLTSLAIDGGTVYDVDGDEVVFQNGTLEFQGLPAGDYYSEDLNNNRIYLSSAVPNTGNDLVAAYSYTPKVLIPATEWRFADTENAVIINSPKFAPRTAVKTITVDQDVRSIDLTADGWVDNLKTVVRGSIVPIDDADQVRKISSTLETELEYINGSEEFQRVRIEGTDLFGYYSVDYEDGEIYLPAGVDGANSGFPIGKIQFKYISSEIHFGIGEKLEPGTDYARKEKSIEPTVGFMHRYAEGVRNLPSRNSLHVRYDAIVADAVDGAEIEQFYTPVLRDLAIVGIGIDPRLGTLESL